MHANMVDKLGPATFQSSHLNYSRCIVISNLIDTQDRSCLPRLCPKGPLKSGITTGALSASEPGSRNTSRWFASICCLSSALIPKESLHILRGHSKSVQYANLCHLSWSSKRALRFRTSNSAASLISPLLAYMYLRMPLSILAKAA